MGPLRTFAPQSAERLRQNPKVLPPMRSIMLLFDSVIQVTTANGSGERDPELPILDLLSADQKQKAIARNSPPPS